MYSSAKVIVCVCVCVRAADAVNDSSDSEVEDRSSARLAHISIDDWLHFKLHREVRFSQHTDISLNIISDFQNIYQSN